jgi:hypothetical protein
MHVQCLGQNWVTVDEKGIVQGSPMFTLPTDRDRELRKDLQANVRSLQRRVRAIWKRPSPLPHFTRHGTDHCERIEARLEEMRCLLHEPLNLAEAYILRCAVWTHDIGMQDARFSLGAKSITDLTAEDYKTIRDEHPDASQNWILTKPEELGLQRNGYLIPHRTYRTCSLQL